MPLESDFGVIDHEAAGWIDGALFALTRFGANPQRHSANAQLCHLDESDIAGSFVRLNATDEALPGIALMSFRNVIKSENSSALSEALKQLFSISIPASNHNGQDNVGLAVWYIMDAIIELTDGSSECFVGNLEIEGQKGKCYLVRCKSGYLAIRIFGLEE